MSLPKSIVSSLLAALDIKVRNALLPFLLLALVVIIPLGCHDGCRAAAGSGGKEVLPPMAYLNRTLFPRLVLYSEEGISSSSDSARGSKPGSMMSSSANNAAAKALLVTRRLQELQDRIETIEALLAGGAAAQATGLSPAAIATAAQVSNKDALRRDAQNHRNEIAAILQARRVVLTKLSSDASVAGSPSSLTSLVDVQIAEEWFQMYKKNRRKNGEPSTSSSSATPFKLFDDDYVVSTMAAKKAAAALNKNSKQEAEDDDSDGDVTTALLPSRPRLSLALISDVQYSHRDEEQRRHFRLSRMKLAHAVAEINANRSQHVDVVVNLGDTVDADPIKYLPEILPLFGQLGRKEQGGRGGGDASPQKPPLLTNRIRYHIHPTLASSSQQPNAVVEASSTSSVSSSSLNQIPQAEGRLPVFHVLGNHDFLGLPESEFSTLHRRLGMPAKYYAVDVESPHPHLRPPSHDDKDTSDSNNKKGPDSSSSSLSGPPWRRFKLIMLDGNDLSLYGTETGSENRKAAEAMLAGLKRRRAKNAKPFNGGLSSPQMQWLKSQLHEACFVTRQLVLIFLHHPMRPHNEVTNLWNDLEAVPLITQYSLCVLAVINGHAHKFMYDYHHAEKRSVHFITMGGMVQSPFTSWGFLDVTDTHLILHGLIFGRPVMHHYDIASGRRGTEAFKQFYFSSSAAAAAAASAVVVTSSSANAASVATIAGGSGGSATPVGGGVPVPKASGHSFLDTISSWIFGGGGGDSDGSGSSTGVATSGSASDQYSSASASSSVAVVVSAGGIVPVAISLVVLAAAVALLALRRCKSVFSSWCCSCCGASSWNRRRRT